MTFEDISKFAKLSKGQIIKNLLVVSFSFSLLFVGFDCLSALQSTINKEHGMGSLSQGLIYAIFSISSLILPKYMIQKIGCKNTMLLSEICYIPWIASNFYPHWTTLMPTAVLSGIATATLWSSQCTYFNNASLLYCSLLNSNANSATESGVKPANSKSKSVNSIKSEPVCLKLYSRKTPKGPEAGRPEKADTESIASFTSRTSTDLSETVPPNSMSRRSTKADISQGFANHEAINARFFGLHSLIFRTSDIWGNLLSFFVLKQGIGETGEIDSTSCMCGAYFCNNDLPPGCNYDNTSEITDERRYVLTGISCAISVSAIFFLIFGLDQIEATKEPVTISADMLLATWNQSKKKQQIYLIPITFLSGISQGYFLADGTQAYIGCSLGTDAIGVVLIAFGAASALVSPLSGWLVKHIGRIPVLLTGVLTAVGTCIWSLIWTPDVSEGYDLYLMAILWGVVLGSTWSQLPAFYGVLFKEDQEAAFATMCVWRGMGFSVAFIYSPYLCTYIKIYFLMVVASLSAVGYLITEKNFVEDKNKIIEQAD